MLKLKNYLLILLMMLVVTSTAFAAVRSITDTEYYAKSSRTSVYSVSGYPTCPPVTTIYSASDTVDIMSGKCSLVLGTISTGEACSNDGGTTILVGCRSNTACGSSTLPYSTSGLSDSCAKALGASSSEVNLLRCDDGTKSNCTYKSICGSYNAAAGNVLSGTSESALTTSLKNISYNHTVTNDNFGPLTSKCYDSTTKNNMIIFRCDTSYNMPSPQTCGTDRTLYSCSMDGATKYKCDYPVCTRTAGGTRDKSLGNSSQTSLIAGSNKIGVCYDFLNYDASGDITRSLVNVYQCQSAYKYTLHSCQDEKGILYNVGSDKNPVSCLWGGAYRNTTNPIMTEIEPSGVLYPFCAPECPSGMTSSQTSCPDGNALVNCVIVKSDISQNQILKYCGCPLDAGGNELYKSSCPAGTLKGGKTCTDSNGVKRFEYCLPSCPSGKTIMDSNKDCLDTLPPMAESKAAMFTSIPRARMASAPSTRAIDFACTFKGTTYTCPSGQICAFDSGLCKKGSSTTSCSGASSCFYDGKDYGCSQSNVDCLASGSICGIVNCIDAPVVPTAPGNGTYCANSASNYVESCSSATYCCSFTPGDSSAISGSCGLIKTKSSSDSSCTAKTAPDSKNYCATSDFMYQGSCGSGDKCCSFTAGKPSAPSGFCSESSSISTGGGDTCTKVSKSVYSTCTTYKQYAGLTTHGGSCVDTSSSTSPATCKGTSYCYYGGAWFSSAYWIQNGQNLCMVYDTSNDGNFVCMAHGNCADSTGVKQTYCDKNTKKCCRYMSSGVLQNCSNDFSVENFTSNVCVMSVAGGGALPDEPDSDYDKRYINNGQCCKFIEGSYVDCIGEPFVDNGDRTCRIDISHYCTSGFMLKSNCDSSTKLCCQYDSKGVVMNSSCLGEGTFITDENTGTCWAGTAIAESGEYCADKNRKKDIKCESGTTTQCCSFKGLSTVSTDVACSSTFVLMAEEGGCSKVTSGIVDSNVCYKNAEDSKASYICSCPADRGYKTSCAAGETSLSVCKYDGVDKFICANGCTQAEIDDGKIKNNKDECKILADDIPLSETCYNTAGQALQRCFCPTAYKTCAAGTGLGKACTFETAPKYKSCVGDDGQSIMCDAARPSFTSSSSCVTAKGVSVESQPCYKEGVMYYMCKCPGGWDGKCTAPNVGGGDSCTVYDGSVYSEKCGIVCRIPSSSQPNVSAPDACSDVGGQKAVTQACISADAAMSYECHCPLSYMTMEEYRATLPAEQQGLNFIGVGASCTYDGDIKYRSFIENCPQRPLFHTAEACSFEGIKGINVKACQMAGLSGDDNKRFYCDCPTSYNTNAQCAATPNFEGTGLLCQLEGTTGTTSKYQYCKIRCDRTNGSGLNNGIFLEDEIADNRSCLWELGQGAVYQECSQNHETKNKCFCGAAYDSRLECKPEDDLSPVIDEAHPACTIDGKAHYTSCQPRLCNESKFVSNTAAGCTFSLGSAATSIACRREGDANNYFECGCDTSKYSEICKYPQIEPNPGTAFCYNGRFGADNPDAKKQYLPGSCKIGIFEQCTSGTFGEYTVFITNTESECTSKIGDGAEARMCEDASNPDIRKYNCYYKTEGYKWTDKNCPVRHVLGGGSILINGIRYYKECTCHSAYINHRYNCAGILSGGACEQDVTPSNNDGTIPGGITKLNYYPYCSCSEDYNKVCDGETNIGVGEPCNGKYKSCQCKKVDLPPNWADNYYGCPNEQKPTGIIKPDGCGGKYYQCEKSSCTWEHTEQCKGDFQVGVGACQDNLGNVAAYKSCKCPTGWNICNTSQSGIGKPCTLKGDYYYASCETKNECAKGEYLTCNESLQIGVNPCIKNDKTYFEKCACASGYNKKCEDGETGVGAYCELNGEKFYTSCIKPATTCTALHQEACAANQEKYDPCVTAQGKINYKCRCPSNYVSCAATSPAEGATTCKDAERGNVYSACAGVTTCTVEEESIYKACTKQQIGLGNSCTDSKGITRYAECQDTVDCKANGYKYVCSGYQASALGDDSCIDDKGNKLFKSCKCPDNWLKCPATNVKGTPCQPLLADGTYGETVYSKCDCGSQYSETCTGNGQSGAEADSCQTSDSSGGEVKTLYKSCSCASEYNKTCTETGAPPTEKSEICAEVKYIGSQVVRQELYKSCGCSDAYKYKCDGTDAGDDANNAAKYTLSGECTTTKGGTSLTRYKSCLCNSTYTATCTSNIIEGADSCKSINPDGTTVTKYVAGSCPVPPTPPCEPTDCSGYTVTMGAIEAQCGHSKNYGGSCSTGCSSSRTTYVCKYSAAEVAAYPYTAASCTAENPKFEPGVPKTFTWGDGTSEERFKTCDCSSAYKLTAASCSSESDSSAPGASGSLLCASRPNKEATPVPAACGPILGLDASDVCTTRAGAEKGKYCICKGLSYIADSCSDGAALLCKRESSANWEKVKCM